MADCESVGAQRSAAHMQRQHPERAGRDLGFLRRAPLGAGGTLPEGRAAALWDHPPLPPQAGGHLQHVDHVGCF